MDFSAFDAYIDSHAEQIIADLAALCAMPSVSTNADGLRDAYERVVALAQRAGLKTEVVLLRDDRPPIVTGESGSGKPLLMVYNHYDVQPADIAEGWDNPPFEPTIRDGHLYARGVADNKVNLVARIAATAAYQAVYGELPVHVRFVWEGEEETGGEQLALFTRAYADWLAEADGCLWESGYRDEDNTPVMTLGVKGIACIELHVKTADIDAHSGHAGIVPNAAWRLVEALNTMRAPDGTVLIDGFMERVIPISEADRALLHQLPLDEGEYIGRYGAKTTVGDRKGIEALETFFFMPTCTIEGLTAGYQGVGSKTIVPCEAHAKLDLRLVPDLDSKTVMQLIRDHLERRGYGDIEVIEVDGGTMPARTQPDTAITQAAIEALTSIAGKPPIIYPLTPGSGPMYELCQAHGVPAVNFGCGWSGSHVHAPNENIRLADFIDGIKAFGRLLEAFPRHCAVSDGVSAKGS